MADPTPYTVSYSFSGYQTANPTLPLPAPSLDAELANIATTLTSTRLAIMDVRRSDGALANGSVTIESLSADVKIGILSPDDIVVPPLYVGELDFVYGYKTGVLSKSAYKPVSDFASLYTIRALTPAADRLPYYTGATTAALATFTTVGRAVVGAATAIAAKDAIAAPGKQLVTAIATNRTFTLAEVEASAGLVVRVTAAATITLPQASTVVTAGAVTIINAHSAAITIAATSDTIDGAANISLPPGQAVSLVCATALSWLTKRGLPGRDVQVYNAGLATLAAGGMTMPDNYLSGMGTGNNAVDAVNDIDIAPGVCLDSTNTYSMRGVGTITKRLDAAWAVGSGNGGLDTGTVNNVGLVTYHLHAIERLDTGQVDYLFSLSPTAPTMPTSYTVFRRIWSVLRSSGTNVLYTQDGDICSLVTPVQDFNVTNPGTAAVSRTVTAPVGVITYPIMSISINNDTTASMALLVTPLSIVATTPTLALNNARTFQISAGLNVMITHVAANTSAQVRTQVQASGASDVLGGRTHGWRDNRGK